MLGRRPACVLPVILGLVLIGTAAQADMKKWTPVGERDFVFGSQVVVGGGPATGHKPESKLFYTRDGRWWAVLGTSGDGLRAPGVWLNELVSHAWQPVFKFPGPGADPWEKADTLFDDATNRLYVSLRDNRSVTGNPRESHLFRFSYDGAGRWSLLSGPTRITTVSPETLTIALDGTGRLWTTFRQGTAIKVGYTAPGGTAFAIGTLVGSKPVTSDDISSVAAFGTAATGRKIGIMWSDQVAKRFSFAWHADSEPPQTWHIETAYGNGVGGCPTPASDRCADDHINLKAAGNRLFAAVKTSLNDDPNKSRSDPLIVLLERDEGGAWHHYPVSPVFQNASRPIVLLDPGGNSIDVFARYHGDVFLWQSAYSTPGFNSGAGIRWTDGPNISDPTSTKQVIVEQIGAVVEGSSPGTPYEYWHNEFVP
jgi:hypothetical protein